jgi:hypothetical protein
MPVPNRHRLAIVLGTALSAGALALPVPASAASAGTVTFNGASVLGLLGCTSRPDTGSLTVAAESTITFVNHLGETASLRVNGQEVGSVPADRGLPLLFHHGPVSITMIPGCLLGGDSAGSVSVSVTAPARGGPSATVVGGPGPAAPAGTQPVPLASRASHSSSPSASGTPDPSGSPAPDAGTAADPAAPSADASVPPVAVQPVVPASGDQHQTSNILVLTAIICVIGVSIAAIRAMIAQRAVRAYTAG